jgi:hypothetical protein
MLGLGLEETLLQYVRAVGWSVTAARLMAISDEHVASKTIVSPFDAGTFTLTVISFVKKNLKFKIKL